MTSPSTTGQALLGLLSIRSWTAYELAGQMRRALRWAWPRSEANLYSEVKRLVAPGFARPIEEDSGGRTRTRYEITDRGRVEVASWLGTRPPAPPQVQAEALLRVFLADQGSLEDLRQTIADTRTQMLDAIEETLPTIEEYATDPPFEDRAHLNVLFMHFLAGFFDLLFSWCDDTEEEMETWGGTTAGVGMTPGTRRMLDDVLAGYRDALERFGRGSDVDGAST